MTEKIRLQKYMSQAWISSRRKAEEYIAAWLVKINGQIAKIWDSIDPQKDKVEIASEEIKKQEKLVYYKFNKPRWIETTCAQRWGKSIIDIVDVGTRVFPIWRLDKETTGLILLTNDGRLANYLMHPKYEHQKEYVVEVFWPIDDEQLQTMSRWVFILWKITKKAPVKRINSGTFSIILEEWRNRQIRRMVESVGKRVKKLKRIRIENIELWNLDFWEYKHLSNSEISTLSKKLWIELG